MGSYVDRVPHRPAKMSEYSEICLQVLAKHGLGSKISVGGGLGLLHFYDYRQTYDVDAWWTDAATDDDRHLVVQLIEETLGRYGEVRTRKWGDVVSIELTQGRTHCFSFQIAQRSAQLEPSTSTPWVAVLLDSFPDLVASKMVALVERGAPRDFRDIHAVCSSALISPTECWELWRKRQRLSGSDTDQSRARLAVETHLTRISLHRPLEHIPDPKQREAAEELRKWFHEVFLNALR